MPKTPLALTILDIYLDGNLTEEVMNYNLDYYYNSAVITKEEGKQLNRIGVRCKRHKTPEEHWTAAGIKIVNINEPKKQLNNSQPARIILQFSQAE